MADEMVLAVQKWVNATYAGVDGYETVTEDGLTGWSTIYSLREGLQHELGISPVAEGFGDQTLAALTEIIGQLKDGYTAKPNITKLIKGAFWCKGISPTDFTDSYGTEVDEAFAELQTDAGPDVTGDVSVNLMAALFDMSAFVLVSGGTAKVRSMQQWLNYQYSDYTGILPCDGIYQRDTNVALIYALQRALGMSATEATGTFGPQTESMLKQISITPTETLPIVQIVEYGLFLNGFYSGDFDTTYTEEVGNAVESFASFMNYDGASTTADYTVIKGLVTSNGDTDRNSDTMDCAAQLTAADISKFVAADFSIVGRYLTGTVGTGADERDKSLTSTEVDAILNGGMKLFPIYEDGGYEQDYFTAAQGTTDAGLVSQAAANLGLPAGTIIYFAVDVDIQDGDIDGTVIPYLSAVQDGLGGTGYRVGIYGTRNVCLHVQSQLGVQFSFVADMSYGWSGNLGFRMPTNWAFDQFTEYTAGSTGIDIDQDASSGRDNGVSYATAGASEAYMVSQLIPKFVRPFSLLSSGFAGIDWTVASDSVVVETPLATFEEEYSLDWTAGDTDGLGTISVTNGKVSVNANEDLQKYFSAASDIASADIDSALNELAPLVGNGNIQAGLTAVNGSPVFKLIFHGTYTRQVDGVDSSFQYTVTFTVTFQNHYLNYPVDVTPVSVPESEGKPFTVPVSSIAINTLAMVTAVGLGILSENPEIILPVYEFTAGTATFVASLLGRMFSEYGSVSFE